MIAYSTSLGSAILWRGGGLDNPSVLMAASLVILAALFDVIENFGLLFIMYFPERFLPFFIPMLVGAYATIKFSLLLAGIAFFIKPYELMASEQVEKKDE